MDQSEGTGVKRYWDTIETPFGLFASWVDAEGRVLRFAFRSTGAERVDRDAERNLLSRIIRSPEHLARLEELLHQKKQVRDWWSFFKRD